MEVVVNNKYKDRLFRMLFGTEENRDNILSLYNALNNTSYKNAGDIEIVTIDNVIYMGMRNDSSFIIECHIPLWEQQSTYNPNMPVRGFMYYGKLYDSYITRQPVSIYGTTLIKLPSPQYVVFYNGTKDEPDEKILRLSDSFSESTRENADIEVKVRMININYGRNKELMEACRPLYEYSWFIQSIRELRKRLKDIGEATGKALTVMPDDFVLKPFLMEHMAEVSNLLSEELQELNAKQLIARANFKKGQIHGEKIGERKGEKKCEKKGIGNMTDLISWLFSQNRDEDVKKAATDPDYLEKLFAEYKEVEKK